MEPGRSFGGYVYLGRDHEAFSPGVCALRTPAQYARLIAAIPKHRLQKRSPAPPSDDPLLVLPPPDLARVTPVVAASAHVHTRVALEVLGAEGSDLRVRVVFDRPDDAEHWAAPLWYGRYLLLLVPRFEGELRVV